VAVNGGAGPSGRPQRATYTFGDWTIEYDSFNADLAADPIPFEASGRVILTGPSTTLTAARVEGRATRNLGLITVRALGGVTIKTAEQGGRFLFAEGREALYEPEKDHARLSGDARATVTSPLLAAPAQLTGEEILIEVKARAATVKAGPSSRVQLTARLKSEPEPISLSAQTLRYESATDRVTAEGRPSIRDPRGTLTADRMEINLAQETNNIMVARAIGNVEVDARFQEPRPQTFQATAREATYVRAEERIALTGGVKGTVMAPGMPKPATFAGEALTFDLKTRRLTMTGQPARAQIVPPPRRPRQVPSGKQ
jgi:lipopolysaccharide transport protein LptA